MPGPLFTIGHSTRTLADFVALLRAWHVDAVADVRTVPRSRHNPQFEGAELARTLPAAGIAYVRMPALGGWRRPKADSTNTGWRVASFRGYADHMETDDFRAGIEALLAYADGRRVAVMCAEAVPWRCHRSLIADALVARGCEVRDIMSATAAPEHRLPAFARVERDRVRYPAPADGATHPPPRRDGGPRAAAGADRHR
ncbi:MAG: DUF488 domain-containing protein [Dehalococcoidia bacterium]|nr:DUF488 domain-containing protein [Dehalococcoidia bacterium]